MILVIRILTITYEVLKIKDLFTRIKKINLLRICIDEIAMTNEYNYVHENV